MNHKSDYLSFAFTLLAVLLLFGYGAATMGGHDFVLSDALSFDRETLTLTVGADQYTAEPYVADMLSTLQNSAQAAADAFLPNPIQKGAQSIKEALFLSARCFFGGIGSIAEQIICGYM